MAKTKRIQRLFNRSDRSAFLVTIAMLLLVTGCQSSTVRPELPIIGMSPVGNVTAEPEFMSPPFADSEGVRGLKSIDLLAPRLNLLPPWPWVWCGMILAEAPGEEPGFVSFEFIGFTETWVPLEGQVRNTFYVQLDPKKN